MTRPTGKDGPSNRLAKETSPYLLLHAHNPVDWYPWGPEAFAKAKAENKPIFLSVGYSSCYWCHVMERESFVDPEIARALNASFVCIKVDREERPDVDQVYMAALQAFGPGGWPMSLFLTPDGRPFFGGTYFPPRDRQGSPGFLTLVTAVAKAWTKQHAEIDKTADQATDGRSQPAQGREQPAQAAAVAGRGGRGRQAARRAIRPGARRLRLQPRPIRADPSSRSRSTCRSCCMSTAAAPGRTTRADPLEDGRRSRSTGWLAAESATTWTAVITATRPTGSGWSRTSRRCSTTMPSSRRFISPRSRSPTTPAGESRPRPRFRSSSAA